MTVLFADVVGSMDIAAALGPERLRELMTDVVTRTGAVVRRYDGTLNQFTGDGIMALFGAPKALEDHARRACLAALAIQGEIQGLAAEVDRRDSITLQLRIGLNSALSPMNRSAAEVEIAAGETALNEAISRQGRVVGIKGPPGIGKSRITREASAAAERHGIEVISTSCESHSSQRRAPRYRGGAGDR